MLFAPLTETAQLRALEPWNAAEFAAFIDRHRDHLSPWLPWATTITDEPGAREWLQRFAERKAQDDGRIYAIWQHGEMVGGILFRVFDVRFGNAEIGVWLAPHAQGQGLIGRAAELLIDWAIRERGLHRIEWRCVPGNEPSVAAAKRLGMRLDGVLRESFPYLGVRHDIQVYSLLAPEWLAR